MSSRRPKPKGMIEYRASDTVTKKTARVGDKVMIITQVESDTSVTIYIGSNEIYCIDAQVLKLNDTEYAEIGNLTKIRWDSVCSIEAPFERGKDTIMILEFAMTYIHNTFPGVKWMKLTDMSERECSGGTVNLAAMKLLTEGKTWYQSRFHAIIHPSYTAGWDKDMDAANKLKESMPWDDFYFYSKAGDNVIAADRIKELYESNNTWQGFFKSILDSTNVVTFCGWISQNGWFNRFVSMRLNINTASVPFIIDVTQFSKEYDIIKGGTYRKTKKAIRRLKRLMK